MYESYLHTFINYSKVNFLKTFLIVLVFFINQYLLSEKYIDVDISQQRMYLFNNNKLIKSYPVSTSSFGEGQIDRLTVGALPAIGSRVTVQVDDQNYSYAVQPGDSLIDVREGLVSALSADGKLDAYLLSDGRIELAGRSAQSSYTINATGATVASVGKQMKFPPRTKKTKERHVVAAEYFV